MRLLPWPAATGGMFTVMTWNLENFELPAAGASDAVNEQYSDKLRPISELITSAGPDLVGCQEVLGGPTISLPGRLMTSLPRSALGGPDCCPSGPTSAVSA